jgi:hypothetical protein
MEAAPRVPPSDTLRLSLNPSVAAVLYTFNVPDAKVPPSRTAANVSDPVANEPTPKRYTVPVKFTVCVPTANVPKPLVPVPSVTNPTATEPL